MLDSIFFFLLSSQLLGFALVGLCHRLLVWPASAIWPTNLSTCATLNALHAGDDAYSSHKGPKQAKVFAAVTIFAFAWAFLPGVFDKPACDVPGLKLTDRINLGYLFTALSYFSIFCWIFPSKSLKLSPVESRKRLISWIPFKRLLSLTNCSAL